MSRHSDLIASVTASPSAAARSAVSASWARSLLTHGLDPAATTRMHRVAQSEINARREASGALLDVASSELTRLFQLVGQPGCGLFLTDAEGVVLDHRMVEADETTFQQGLGLDVGAVCSEAADGTNGMGTCLAEKRPVVIHREEHFLERNTAFTCIGAPVFGAQGEIVAALDLSTGRVDHTKAGNRLLAHVLIQTARKIEERLFRALHPKARFLVPDSNPDEPPSILAIDNDDLVIGANRAARLTYGLGLSNPFEAIPASDLLGQGPKARDMDAVNRSAIVRALTRSGWNVSRAARQLGIGRTTLYRQMKQLGIER